jgi:hypothetical protein
MNRIITILILLATSISLFSQAPNTISYQAVVRNTKGELIKKENVGVRISLLVGSVTSTPIYVEKHAVSTNANGLFSMEIGGGTVLNGVFNNIDWSHGPYFVKTEIDPNGGTSYGLTTTTQLLSVPFALYATTAGNGFTENVNVTPRIAPRGQKLAVSFSGSSIVSFEQASSSTPVMLTFTEASSTTQASSTTNIYPVSSYFINSKRFDAIFDIPSYVPSGLYNIVLSPFTSNKVIIFSSFKIY